MTPLAWLLLVALAWLAVRQVILLGTVADLKARRVVMALDLRDARRVRDNNAAALRETNAALKLAMAVLERQDDHLGPEWLGDDPIPFTVVAGSQTPIGDGVVVDLFREQLDEKSEGWNLWTDGAS